MKSFAQFCFAFCFAAFTISGVYAGEIVRDYPLIKIAPHTYVIHGPLGYPSVENQGFMNNPAFVITKTGVVVIDPGSSVQAGRMLLKQMRTVTKLPVTHVFNTHVHGDHWLGNQAITDVYPKVIVIGHPAMIKKLTEGEAEEWVNVMDKSTNGFTRGTKAVAATVATKDGDEFKIACSIHPLHSHKFRKFNYTRAAPCRPKVYETVLV